jgi:hypothetical protein
MGEIVDSGPRKRRKVKPVFIPTSQLVTKPGGFPGIGVLIPLIIAVLIYLILNSCRSVSEEPSFEYRRVHAVDSLILVE